MRVTDEENILVIVGVGGSIQEQWDLLLPALILSVLKKKKVFVQYLKSYFNFEIFQQTNNLTDSKTMRSSIYNNWSVRHLWLNSG